MAHGARLSVLPAVSSPLLIESLPNELLALVFSYLDNHPPSASSLYDEPRFSLTQSDHAPIKACSLVSIRWRHIIMPLLFQHAQFLVRHQDVSTSASHKGLEQIQEFYQFVVDHALHNVVSTFTLIIHTKDIDLSHIEEYSVGPQSKFWGRLFGRIDPDRLLIVAHAQALGALTTCDIFLQDEWTFRCPCHYLYLQRPRDNVRETLSKKYTSNTRRKPFNSDYDSIADNPTADILDGLDSTNFASTSSEGGASTGRENSTLWQVRPWSKLLLNEGSFIRAYATYEFWLRQPPSILSDLLGDRETMPKPLISPTIRDLSYIGQFPMVHHFNTITSRCPPLDRLYVQLVPRNEVVSERGSALEQVEVEDLWMERNSCYALLMRELFSTPPVGNFKDLKIFESGDAADEEAWELAVEYVKRNSNGWKIAGQGVFVKDIKDVDSQSAEGDAEVSAVDGSLVRLAFNGVQKLPVSSFPLYGGQQGG